MKLERAKAAIDLLEVLRTQNPDASLDELLDALNLATTIFKTIKAISSVLLA